MASRSRVILSGDREGRVDDKGAKTTVRSEPTPRAAYGRICTSVPAVRVEQRRNRGKERRRGKAGSRKARTVAFCRVSNVESMKPQRKPAPSGPKASSDRAVRQRAATGSQRQQSAKISNRPAGRKASSSVLRQPTGYVMPLLTCRSHRFREKRRYDCFAYLVLTRGSRTVACGHRDRNGDRTDMGALAGARAAV